MLKSLIGKAIGHALGQWKYSVRYIDGRPYKALPQMPASAGQITGRDGEVVSGAVSGEARPTRLVTENAGQALLEQALARENMERAWKRVKANNFGLLETI